MHLGVVEGKVSFRTVRLNFTLRLIDVLSKSALGYRLHIVKS